MARSNKGKQTVSFSVCLLIVNMFCMDSTLKPSAAILCIYLCVFRGLFTEQRHLYCLKLCKYLKLQKLFMEADIFIGKSF